MGSARSKKDRHAVGRRGAEQEGNRHGHGAEGLNHKTIHRGLRAP